MAKNFELGPSDQFHPGFDQKRIFERPRANQPTRSVLYINTRTNRWLLEETPLPPPSGQARLADARRERVISEADYQKVLEEHNVPPANIPDLLFVASVADKLFITVGKTEEELRVDTKHRWGKPAETPLFELAFATHADFVGKLVNVAQDAISVEDFTHFNVLARPAQRRTTGWQSSLRIGKRSLFRP